jgi:hypothetical protein
MGRAGAGLPGLPLVHLQNRLCVMSYSNAHEGRVQPLGEAHLAFLGAGRPMRLLQKEPTKDDPDPKPLSCYGLYLPELQETWLRFVDGRLVSAITTHGDHSLPPGAGRLPHAAGKPRPWSGQILRRKVAQVPGEKLPQERSRAHPRGAFAGSWAGLGADRLAHRAHPRLRAAARDYLQGAQPSSCARPRGLDRLRCSPSCSL